MGFSIASFVGAWLGSVEGIDKRIADFLKSNADKYPDTAALSDALAQWLHSELEPYFPVSTSLSTLKGIAADIVNGTAGIDPDAWMGSV